MPVGTQPNNATVDNQLTQLAVQMRELMQQAQNLSLQVNADSTGQATLEGYGYSAGDATTALAKIAALNTVAEFYYGSLGSSSGTVSYNSVLSDLWACQ